MKNVERPLLLNSTGTTYADWEEFGQETGFPDDELPSSTLLQQLALDRFRPNELVLVAGVPGRSTARAMLDAGVHVLSLACSTEDADQWNSLTVVAGLDFIPVVGKFSGAVCFERVSHLHDPRQAMEELHRILVPGGLLLFDVLTRDDRDYGIGQPLDTDCFVVANIVYRFFDRARVKALLDGLFTVIETYINDGENHNCATYVVRKIRGTK